MDIYNRISVFRAERSVSRRDLADAVGVNPQTIGYLERGDYNPSLELAMKIAAYFGVAVEHLFSFTPFESVAATLRRAQAQGAGIPAPPNPTPADARVATTLRGDS